MSMADGVVWVQSQEVISKIKIKLLEFSKIKIKFLYEIYAESFTQLKAKAETVNVFTDADGNLKRLSGEVRNLFGNYISVLSK